MNVEANKRDVGLTVDVIALISRGARDHEEIVLIKRAKPPFEDKYVLPGGHVEVNDPSLAHAAARELYEETGITVDPLELKYFTHLDRPGRDPRGCKVSIVFLVEVDMRVFTAARPGSDAAGVAKVFLSTLDERNMGFDHYDAILTLRAKLRMERISCG